MSLIRPCRQWMVATGLCLLAAGRLAIAAPNLPPGWDRLWDYRYETVETARRTFETTLRDDPADPAAAAGLAASLAIGVRFTWRPGDDLARARQLAAQAATAAPDRDETLIAGALIDILQLDFAAAEQAARQLVDRDIPSPAGRLVLGESLLHRGRWQEAEAQFRAALENDPDRCAALAGLADALRQQERHQEAFAGLEEGPDPYNGCFPALLVRAATAHLARRTATALRMQERLLQEFPHSQALIHLNAAAILVHIGRYREALATYRSLPFPAGPAQLRLLRDLGEAESLRRLDPPTAITAYESLLQNFPVTRGGEFLRSRLLFPAYRSLATLYRERGETGAGIALLERAAREPDAPGGMLRRLGDSYSRIGLNDSAAGAYRQAVEADRFDSLYEEGRALLSWLRTVRGDTDSFRLPGDQMAPLDRFTGRVEVDQRSSSWHALARAASIAGHRRAASRYLDRAIRAGYRNRAALLQEPDFEPIRSDRRFQRLVARLNRRDSLPD